MRSTRAFRQGCLGATIIMTVWSLWASADSSSPSAPADTTSQTTDAARRKGVTVDVRRELSGFAVSGALGDWTRLWAVLPDTLSSREYGALSVLLDSLEASTGIAPSSPEPWTRWAQVRAGLAVRAADYSAGAIYFRSAREHVSPGEHQDLWVALGQEEIGCLERGSDYQSLLAAIESVAPYLPYGPWRLYGGWAGRLRYKLGRLVWDSEVVGTFLGIDHESSGLHSVVYTFVTSAGDTLSLDFTPATVFRHGLDVWTPGGLGCVFDVDDAPIFESPRQVQFEIEGRQARVQLAGKSSVVLAEFLK